MNNLTKAYLGKVNSYISLAKSRELTKDEKIDFRSSLDMILDNLSLEFSSESEKVALSKLYMLRAKIYMGNKPEFCI